MDLPQWLNYAAFAGGLAMYLTVMADVFITTISLHGGGPLTTWLLRLSHRLLASSAGGGHPNAYARLVNGFARYSNLLLTLTLFLAWFGLLLLSLTFLLLLAPDAISGSGSEAVPTIWQRLYFAGASITTAGFGDYVPGTTRWQFFTVLMATSGLVVSSLGVAYVINICGAALQQRRAARHITNCGTTVPSFLAAGWTGKDFTNLEPMLSSITADILEHTENHLAYPLVHYVRTDDIRDSLPSSIAVADEALTVLLLDVPQGLHPNPALVLGLRRAITAYLESINTVYIVDGPSNAGTPEYPSVEFLSRFWEITPRRGLLQLSDEERDGLERRRCLLHSVVESQGRTWEEALLQAKPPEESYDVSLYRQLDVGPPAAVARLRELEAEV